MAEHSSYAIAQPPRHKRVAVDNTVTLNVGGTLFQTLYSTLQKYPQSPLAGLQPAPNGEIFLDRNPQAFGVVLDFLRTGKLHLGIVEEGQARDELSHWGLLSAVSDTLPNDVLAVLFAYLPLRVRARVVAQVCRQWRAVVLSTAVNCVVHCHASGHLAHCQGAGEDSEEQGTVFNGGTVLRLGQPIAKQDTMRVDMAGTSGHLPLFCCSARLSSLVKSHMHRLKINNPGFLPVSLALKAPSVSLTCLTISNSQLTAEELQPITNLHALRSLTLFDCSGATPNLLADMEALPTLISLDIDSCPHLCGSRSPDVVASFGYLSRATALRAFLWRDGRQEPATVGPLLTAMGTLSKLKRLYLDVSLSLASDDMCLVRLGRLSSLCDLELDTEDFDSVLDLLAVLKKMPQLRRLQCDFYCDRDTEIESVLHSTLGCLTHLESFGTVHSVSRHFWTHLPVMPKLKVLSTYTHQPEIDELQCLVQCATITLQSLESLRLVLENTHEVTDPTKRLTASWLLDVLSPLAFLRRLDLTGYYVCSDVHHVGRENLRARLASVLPATVITNSGSCTDCLFSDVDDL